MQHDLCSCSAYGVSSGRDVDCLFTHARHVQDPGDKAEMQEIIECIDTGTPFGLIKPAFCLANLSLIDWVVQ